MKAGAVETLEPGIRRILAPNPSPMTGPGTNSYLIGAGDGLLLVDPGPEDVGHRAAILAALAPGEHIAAIVVTHAHLDHSGGVAEMQRHTGAPTLAFGAAGEARSPLMQQLVRAGLTGGGEGIDGGFRPDRRLRDGETLSGPWGEVEVLHCPGHMAEHICLGFGGTLFSGDHAMGWSTSLVSPPDGDMGAFMTSLQRLMAREWRLMLPAHGQTVRPVAARLEELYRHRRMREAQICAALIDGPATAAELSRRLYTETPKALLPAATRNILAHLIDLLERNQVHTPLPVIADSRFQRS